MTEPFLFACPACKTSLIWQNPGELYCPSDGSIYHQEEGVWRFLTPQRNLEYWQFIKDYETVRYSEGRGSLDPAYYLELPFRDLTGRFTSDWKIRSKSFRALIRTVVKPFEKEVKRPLKILDLGAGNGWLSYRLACRGHQTAALDLQTNALDGLGAFIHYDASFLPVQADFHHLPFCDSQADLVIFNASFHYSVGYVECLCEAQRVLQPRGRIVILDTPIYHDASSGEKMVREREDKFRSSYGFASNSIHSENFLTYARLSDLARQVHLQWKLVNVSYGLGWDLRKFKARVSGKREPAVFRIVVGTVD